MYLVRETFTAKPGKAGTLAKLFKEVMSEMPRMRPRVMTDFIAQFNTVVLETGSSSLGVTPTIFPDGVRVEAQVLWGSIGWATPAAFGVALADPGRRTVLRSPGAAPRTKMTRPSCLAIPSPPWTRPSTVSFKRG